MTPKDAIVIKRLQSVHDELDVRAASTAVLDLISRCYRVIHLGKHRAGAVSLSEYRNDHYVREHTALCKELAGLYVELAKCRICPSRSD